MKKCCLPKISKSVAKAPINLKSQNFSSPFNSMLKTFKLRRPKVNFKSPTNETNGNNSYKGQHTVESSTIYESLNPLRKEENQILIDGQKYLIKIYESNYSSKIDEIKSEAPKNNEINIIKPAYKKIFPSIKGDNGNKLETLPSEIRYNSIKKKYGFNKFRNTNYVAPNCMKDFYDKYSKFNTIARKYFYDNNTPSLAFIKSSNEEKIIPNPLGLLRRTGDSDKLDLNYQKVGDDYMTVLSNSLKYSEHINSLDVSGNRLTVGGAEKLFKVLNENKTLAGRLQDINLAENNLGNQDLSDLILFLKDPNAGIENLNLYGNLIGDDNAMKICENLGKYIEHRLTSLNLGKNNIHDKSINTLCNMAKLTSGIRALNLSHNWLHNKSAAQLMRTLNDNYELKVLDLSWNCIGDDLVIIPSFEELVNSEIKHPEKVFDNYALEEALSSFKLNLRRNPLLPPLDEKSKKEKNDKKDKDKPNEEKKEPTKVPLKPKTPSDFALALGEYFTNDSIDLIHLDISHNNINYVDCRLISEKVKLNHTILGMHLDGNEMEINELGFIAPVEKNSKNNQFFSESQISYGIDKAYKLRKTKIDAIRKIRCKNNCWICDGFREIEFEYVPKDPIDDPNNHLVKIHLNFDDYKPFDMIYNDGKYHMARMCPPGDIDYFFTIDTVPVKMEGNGGTNEFKKIENNSEKIKYIFDDEFIEEVKNQKEKLTYEIVKSQDSVETSDKNEKEDNKIQSPERTIKINKGILTLDINQKISIEVDTLCKMHIKYNNSVIDEGYRKLIKFSEPRPEKIIDKFVKPRTPWSFPSSIWAYYGYDYNDVSEKYLNKCFKFDFDRCQFQKDFKTEESYETLKAFLRERYRDIIDCYKYYSSLSGFSVWQITQNNLTEFINHCNNFCDKTYDINNVFLTQKTVCGNLVDKEDRKKKNKNLSDNLVRHQFMNLLVKVSKDKYITVLKTLTDPLEAVETAFENHFDYAIKGFEYHKWRQERYYNEKVDNFLKAYLPILNAVYLSWAKQKGPTKKDVWMLLDEFNTLVQSIVDVNEYPLRENPYLFNMSMNLQVNEIYTDKHLNMLLPEFLEALCRVVDKYSPYPPNENKEDWPMPKRQAQSLVSKLENILPLLIKLINHPDCKVLKDKFPTPPKDISTGLYNPNYDNPFYQGFLIKTTKESSDLGIKLEENIEKDKNGDEKGENNEENKKDKNEDDNNNEEKKDEEKKDEEKKDEEKKDEDKKEENKEDIENKKNEEEKNEDNKEENNKNDDNIDKGNEITNDIEKNNDDNNNIKEEKTDNEVNNDGENEKNKEENKD